MTSRDSLHQLINQAKCLSCWLHQKTNQLEIPVRGSSDRYFIGMALLQQALDLVDAMIVLMETRLLGPAYALARPLFECYVRSIWILESASDKNIEQFQSGKVPPIIELLTSLEGEDSDHAMWIRSNYKNIKHFHDFTHTGIEHVLRRIGTNSVEAKFPQEEQIYLINLGVEICIRVGSEIFSPNLIDDREAIDELHIRARSFCRKQLK